MSRRPYSLQYIWFLLPLVVGGRRCLGSISCAYWADNSLMLNKHWLSSAGTRVRPSRNRKGFDNYWGLHNVHQKCVCVYVCISFLSWGCHYFFTAQNVLKTFSTKSHQGHSSEMRKHRTHINVATNPVWTSHCDACDGGNLLLLVVYY